MFKKDEEFGLCPSIRKRYLVQPEYLVDLSEMLLLPHATKRDASEQCGRQEHSNLQTRTNSLERR